MSFWKENRSTLILMAITGVLLIFTGITYGQSFFRILPLFNSLFIALLQSRVHRLAPLLGGLNCFLYAVVYFHYTLYGSAAYVFFVAGPVQLVTFFRWRKRPFGNSTILRRMSFKTRLTASGICALAFALLYVILGFFGSEYMLLDNALTLIGILISFLTMFAYVEYTFLNVISTFMNIILYARMMQSFPEQITFFIFYIYSFICAVKAFIHIQRIYNTQKELSQKK